MENFEKTLILLNGVEKDNLKVEREYLKQKESIKSRIKNIQTLCDHDFVFGFKKQRLESQCHCLICHKEFMTKEEKQFRYFINFEDICNDNNINVISIHDYNHLYRNLFNLLNSTLKSRASEIETKDELYELLVLKAKENIGVYYSALLEMKSPNRLMK